MAAHDTILDMRKRPTLTERRSPWVVFARRDAPWLRAESAGLRERGGRVVRLDGRELRDPKALFAAFAQALSFPGYFGHNWDALVDCLHDLHGHEVGARDVAVLIEHADATLGGDPELLGLFVSVLCQAAWHANLQLDADGIPHQDRDPFTLHFVFLLHDLAPAAFAEAAARGSDVQVSLGQGYLAATLTGDDWPDRN
ncbi:barstar family protein [Streptomyces sp. NPDC041068]|uniref:barstar family protein n=1 Tax=Streptomyces sp. NPDC041068 TaxID=3155130 RepID=UPI00340183BF